MPLRRGTTWFENERIGVARRESVAAAETRFLAWYDTRFGGGPLPWLCGFSNGGAFAGHLLLRHPGLFRGAALLSAPLVLPPWPAGILRGRSVFYGRGSHDMVVPAAMFEAAEAYLAVASGGTATLSRYDIAHEIAPCEIRDLAAWFAVRSGPPARGCC